MTLLLAESNRIHQNLVLEHADTDIETSLHEGSSLDCLIAHAEELDRQFTSHEVSEHCPVELKVDQINIGDDNLRLTSAGWSKIADACKAPLGYWSRFPPESWPQFAQYHLDHDPNLAMTGNSHGSIEAVAFRKRFVGFRSTHLVHLDFATIMQTISAALGDRRQSYLVNKFIVNEDSISVELITPGQTHAVKVGDDVAGGIAVSHSILGNHPTTVDLFVHRLFCRNGLTLRHCVGHAAITRSRRLKDNGTQARGAAIDQIERMVLERLSHQTALFGSLSQLPDAQIGRPAGADDEEAIRRFLMPSLRATHLWSDQLWQRVLAPAWRHVHGGNGELNEFAAVNTITYVATHQSDLSFRQRRTLARLAGLLSFRRVHVCPRCNSAIVGT